jgi:hypothetical protein
MFGTALAFTSTRGQRTPFYPNEDAMRLLLIVLLFLLVVGMLPLWPYSASWGVGYFPSGILGLLLLVVVLMAIFGSRDRPVV